MSPFSHKAIFGNVAISSSTPSEEKCMLNNVHLQPLERRMASQTAQAFWHSSYFRSKSLLSTIITNSTAIWIITKKSKAARHGKPSCLTQKVWNLEKDLHNLARLQTSLNQDSTSAWKAQKAWQVIGHLVNQMTTSTGDAKMSTWEV